MLSPNTRDVLLFVGQGSSQHLAKPASTYNLRERLGEKQRSAFDSFLHRCSDSFRDELNSASPEERSSLGVEPQDVLREPTALLVPPQPYQSHPVFETLSLYVYEILELMLFQCQQPSHRVTEAAGVCTGILPAILATSFSSFDTEQFIKSAVELFRLAFWIGLRASLYCTETSLDSWKDNPCVLSVFGVPEDALKEKLAAYADQQSAQGSNSKLRISAVFDDGNISISGQSIDLERLKARLTTESIQCRLASVHAIYHGGSDMRVTMRKTLNDAKRRDIKFPTWESLQAPLRSATNGALMRSGDSSQSESLLESAMQSIFIDKVDWRATTNELHGFLSSKVDRDSATQYRVLGFGPGSRSLVQFAKGFPPNPKIEIIESWADYPEYMISDDIAIIGVSVNYPGGKGQDKLWELLEKAESTAQEIPSSRFDLSQHYATESSSVPTAQRLNTKYGNFIDDPFAFDAAHFNISPREAKSIDPQQRLLLHAALDALEDAGYSPDSTPAFQKDTFGVYMGVATGDYVDNLSNDIDVYYSPGTLRAFLSGRISYAFGFKGPSMVIDTACSSSMVALYHACMALRSGECTTALAGGVNVITSPYMYCGLSRAHFLSPTGQCKPFDVSADGYCRAEGCGIVVVKKLSSAINDGDHIYGVIRGIGVNQCGTAKSITHPDAETQATLVKGVLSSSRINPSSISVVEAHGTGTQAGDFAEASSLNSAFGSRSADNPLYLSSVKGNIGHSEAASGIASLAKILLMMEKNKIPPQASFKRLNPRLEKLVAESFVIPTQLLEWNRGSGASPRRALLNNFGASGSNVAMIVEEYVAPVTRSRSSQTSRPESARSHHVFSLSAKTEKALETLRLGYISYINKNPNVPIDSICYTAGTRRQRHTPYRRSIAASSLAELLEGLSQPINSDDIQRLSQPAKTVFAFSGQGSIHKGMGAEILRTTPLFRDTVAECDGILSRHGFPTVTPFLEDSPSLSYQRGGDDVVISQCACFVLEYALASLWIRWGVTPDIIVGHSIGEYAAFAIAGALSLESALVFLARRARLMADKCPPHTTGMVACRLPASNFARLLEEKPEDFSNMSIACHNSPEDLVLAGPLRSLARFIEYCKDKGIRHKQLEVPFGFHSPAMDPILEDLAASDPNMKTQPPKLRIGSSLYGRLLGDGEKIESQYFVTHAREPVNFSGLIGGIEKWAADSELSVLEIGPSPSTESMFKKTLSNKPYTFLPSLHPSRGQWATITAALQSLSLRNYNIDWRAIYHGSRARFLRSLPHYPLSTTPFVRPFKHPQLIKGFATKQDEEPKQPRYAFLAPTSIPITEGSTTMFTTPMSQIKRFVKAHNVGGVPLCPASIYLEIVLQALTYQDSINTKGSVCVFEDITFEHPLVYTEDGDSNNQQDVQTQLDTRSAEAVQFSSTSRASEILCTGHVRRLKKGSQASADLFARKMAHAQRLKRSFTAESTDPVETFSAKTLYHRIFPRVVAYDEPFLTIQQLTINPSGLEGYGSFRLEPLSSDQGGRFISSPAFVDTLLHAAGFIANTYVTPDIACICVNLEEGMVPREALDVYAQDLKVYCSLVDIEHSFIANAYALDSRGKLLAYVEGMHFKKIKLKSFQAHLSRVAARSTNKRPIPVSNAHELPPRQVVTRSQLDANLGEGIPSGQNMIEGIVRSTIREVCGASDDLTPLNTLAEIGVDSLLFIEMAELLGKRFPHAKVLKSELESCKTVGDITNVIVEASDQGSASSEAPSLVLTNVTAPTSGVATPLQETQSGQIPRTGSPIRALFLDVCGLDPTEEEKDRAMSLLGVDSLLSIELVQEVQGRLGISIAQDHDNISDLTYRQLEDMCTAKTVAKYASGPSRGPHLPVVPSNGSLTASNSIESLSGLTSLDETPNFPKLLQRQVSKGPKSSLYMFHDGSGLCGMYSRLPSIDRTVHGIFSLDSPTSSNRTNQTMEDLAAVYIERAKLASQSEIILSGWSFGGVLAFEVSRQLRKLGKTVKGVILIDSPVPIKHQALPEQVVSYVLNRGSTSSGTRAVKSEEAKKARDSIATQFKKHAMMLQNYSLSPARLQNKTSDIPCVILRCTGTIDTKKLCGVAYPWLNDTEAQKESIQKWEQVVGRTIPVLELDCDHFEVFETAHIPDVSKKLQDACAMLDA